MISAESQAVACLGGENHMSARVWVTLWVLEDTTYPSGAPTVSKVMRYVRLIVSKAMRYVRLL